MDTFGAAVPLGGDAQLSQRLLQHPCLAAWPLDQHRAVGNAAGQISDQRLLIRWDMSSAPQVGQQHGGPLDIQIRVHSSLYFPPQPGRWPMFRCADITIIATMSESTNMH